MPLESISIARLSLINPQLSLKAYTLAEMMELAGYPIRYVQGLRTWGEQQKLWQIGRDEKGNVVDETIVVTHAPPGHSWHEYGMAVDAVPLVLIDKPGWDPKSTIWQVYGNKVEALGLTWGGSWSERKRDLPHAQMTGSFPVSPTDEVRQIFHAVGMKGVWVEAGLQILRT